MREDASQIARAAVERVARESYGRLTAIVARRTRDLELAQDVLAEAFADALATWPTRGVPARPEAWLVEAARRTWVDRARRRAVAERDERDVIAMFEDLAADADGVKDRRLELLFVCAHPDIDPGVRTPLMMQVVLGLSAEAIGGAFLVAPATMGQRLSRAKTRIRASAVPFELPEPSERIARTEDVLEAIYGAYGVASAELGQDGERAGLRSETVWLARIAADLLRDPEADGLLALLLYVEARRLAQVDATGVFVPLANQDCATWSLRDLREAEALLSRAGRSGRPGRFQLEAAIQSAHVQRAFGEPAPREAIVGLYEALVRLYPTVGARLGHAAALADVEPHAAVALLDGLAAEAHTTQPYWAVRAHVLTLLADEARAHDAYARALGLTTEPAVRAFLQGRAREVRGRCG
jgi:RNA polymerase sigma-70 factor (ECF subfamily)